MKWQDLATAPRDGRGIRARGRDWGDPNGRYHYVLARWATTHNGQQWVDARGVQLVYLTHWRED